MTVADDHRRFLKKTGYFVPDSAAAQLSRSERDLLVRYGHWLEALANGVLTPTTVAQQHFVRAAAGDVDAESPFEVAWVKFRRLRSHQPRRHVPEPDDFEDMGSYGEEGLPPRE
jgi:uncharacterized protein YifE (UPF0438 family)